MASAFKLLAGSAAVGAAIKGLQYVINEAAEAQKVMAQTEAVLRSTGGAAGFSAGQIANMAGEMARLSTFDDESIQSMQNVLLTFTQIKGEQFKGATQAILDMSAALGTDLQSAAIQVGKALNDPITGVSALQRVGVSFTQQQKELIKTLVETGRAAEAQQLILAELNTEFGGSAAAQLDTYAGQVEQLKNNFANMGEALGEKVIPHLTEFTRLVNENIFTQQDFDAAVQAGVISQEQATVAMQLARQGYIGYRDAITAEAMPALEMFRLAEEREIAVLMARSNAMREVNQGMIDGGDIADRLTAHLDALAQVAEDERLAQLALRLDELHANMQPFVLDADNAASGLFDMAEQFGINVGVLEQYAQQQGLVDEQTVALREAFKRLADQSGEFADYKQVQALDAATAAIAAGEDPARAMSDAINDANYNLGLLAPAWDGAAKAVQEKAPSVTEDVDDLAGSISLARAHVLGFEEVWGRLESKTIELNVQTTGAPGHYAHGLDFTVPPGYPNDTYPFAGMLTSGERVTVTPANQNFNFNVYPQDAVDVELFARRVGYYARDRQ